MPGPGGRDGVCSQGSIPACTEADPPGETATAAGGTHPTGMHSCCKLIKVMCIWLSPRILVTSALPEGEIHTMHQHT